MVSIIDWHFPKSRHLGFDLDHQIELGGGRPMVAFAVIGASACAA
jgi:hypothetical protein